MLSQDDTLRKTMGQEGLETVHEKGYALEERGKRSGQLYHELFVR